MPDLMGGIPKRANQFKGPNRNKLSYNYYVQEAKNMDDAEGGIDEAFVNYALLH